MKTKTCKICQQEKPLSEYSKSNRTKDGYSLKCRACSPKKGRPGLSDEEKFLTGGGRYQKKEIDYIPREDLPFKYLVFTDNSKKNSFTYRQYMTLKEVYEDIEYLKELLSEGIIPRIILVQDYYKKGIRPKEMEYHYTVVQVIQDGNIKLAKHTPWESYSFI